MPIYHVLFTAEVTYEAYVCAPDEETAKSSDAYGLAIESPATDHQWQDADILGETEEAAMVDFHLGCDCEGK